MKNRLVIIGCGGHGKAVLDVVLFNNSYKNIVFVDENARENEKILGYPVLKEYKIEDEAVFVAIGENSKRTEMCKKYYNNLVSIVSKNAYLGTGVKIGKGVFVAHNAHIGIMSEIEDFCIVNTSASVDHECILHQGSFVAPNSTLCGKVILGENTFVGAGAIVRDGIRICDKTIIGAGGVVVKDISETGLYLGCPVTRKEG